MPITNFIHVYINLVVKALKKQKRCFIENVFTVFILCFPTANKNIFKKIFSNKTNYIFSLPNTPYRREEKYKANGGCGKSRFTILNTTTSMNSLVR